MSSRSRKKCYDMKMNMGFMHAENPIWREALGRKMRAIKRESKQILQPRRKVNPP